MPYYNCPRCRIEISYIFGEAIPKHKCKFMPPIVEPHFLDSAVEGKKDPVDAAPKAVKMNKKPLPNGE